MTISSRTPEGTPSHCPLCDKSLAIEPSAPFGDAPCPHCGSLLWFLRIGSEVRWFDRESADEARERLFDEIAERFDVSLADQARMRSDSRFIESMHLDSLEMVELVMELEE